MIKNQSSCEAGWRGRHHIIHEILCNSCNKHPSIDIGSKTAKQGDITVDINIGSKPDVVADARYLPFRPENFARVFFTEVVEHLPKGTEKEALLEIKRVLMHDGELILTTPNHRWLYTYLDPAYYVMGHRHYSTKVIRNLIEEQGFRIEMCFTRGGVWQAIWVLYHSFFCYLLKRKVPLWLEKKKDKEYDKSTNKGYIIFIRAA